MSVYLQNTLIFMCIISQILCTNSDLMEKFTSEGITQDMRINAPPKILQVRYGSLDVKTGSELSLAQTKNQPTVSWDADPLSFYTIVMNDPDAPSRADPKFREWQHWCVVNIPGGDLSAGEVMTEYVGPSPPKGTKYHRYVILVYRQRDGRQSFSEVRKLGAGSDGRAKHSVANFARQQQLGNPIAGNFFVAQNVG